MGQVQRFDCIYKIVCFNFSNMSINYRYPIIAALTLLTAVACEEEKPVTDALSSSYTMEVGSAVYNDVAGSFDIGLVSDGISLDFSLTQQNSAILSDVPVPMVGHYTMSSYDISYVVSPGAVWIDAQEQEHSITEAEVHVNVNGTSCSMTGTVSDEEGYTFDFTCGDIVFSHSIDRTTAVDNVYGESLGDMYSLYMYGDSNVKIDIDASSEDLFIESGTYDVVAASVMTSSSEAVNAVDGVVCIERENGAYVIGGYLYMENEEQLRIWYAGPIQPTEMLYPDLFTALGGEWTLAADRIWGSNGSEWVFMDESYRDFCTATGIPEYRYMLFSDIFDDNFSTMIGVDIQDGVDVYIPISWQSNPVARVYGGTSTYILFLTLYDPVNGYLMTRGNISLELSEDYSTMSVIGTQSETEDGITLNYEYVGLIGRNESTGGYSRFNNWPFLRLPVFTRGEATAPAGAPAMTRSSAGTTLSPVVLQDVESARIEEVVPAESITRIIPIKR